MKLAAVLAAKQKPKIATTGMTPPTRRGRPPVKKGKGRGKGWRKGLGKKAESVQSGSSSATTTDAESFRSDADTGEGTSSGFSQQPDSVISSSVREDSVSGEADSGVGPLFTAAQKEAMADHYGDTGTALRYTALKEWCMSKGASLLHAGSVRNKFRALLQDGIDREEAGGIGVETVERVKEAMGRVRDPHLEEFKRQICLEIIRSRNPQYGVLRKEVERTKDPT
ncbi:uncharacterized protein LOC129589068 [Paramacrobiotus metropolitanus]|uniref:uncharacterized protein LOC129589068 n=1 Tax=Paramacrobiotus metropolitanus TaxID=2943436 RepID=UPI002445B431|nr:uncharacterized protein LOC129589068 [Paramacrobiotus metropolitanus]